MVTLIANQLDSNYSQRHINAFYTQAKKLIVDPFDFIVFTNDDEMKLLETTKKKDGYIQGITFHVPKYGKDWVEIDIMQHTQPGDVSLFVTPNVILNDPKTFFNYKCKGIDKLVLEDGNFCYVCNRNEQVEKILTKWDDMEDDMTFQNHSFADAFYSNEVPEFSFIQNTNHNYPTLTLGDIVVLPYWYEDFTPEQLELSYNRETDLYPYLPERVEMELSNGTSHLTRSLIENNFDFDFLTRSKFKRIKLIGEPITNPELIEICQYLMGDWGIAIDLETEAKANDLIWWNNLGVLFYNNFISEWNEERSFAAKNIGNITIHIDTANPDEQVIKRSQALIEQGCRVFWHYTQTHLSQVEDLKKAKISANRLKFTGFIYKNEMKEEVKTKEKKTKKEMPDYSLIDFHTLKTVQQDDIYKERKIIFSPHVECEGKVKNGFYLSAKGNVFPCKHVAANVTTAHDSPEHKTELLYDWDKNNISNNNLETIFTNDFYKGYFNNLLKLNPQVIHNEQEGIC